MERQLFSTRFPRMGMFLGMFLGAALLFFFALQAQAQGLSSMLSSGKGAAPQSTPATDLLGRDTPRNAVYSLLEACHANDLVKAARYLDLSKIPSSQQQKLGPERARQLCLVLDRDPHFELEQLDNTPGGRQNDQLPPDVESLVEEQIGGRSIPLYLERAKRDNGTVWLVSGDAVQRLPELSSLTAASPIEKWMPAPLVNTKLAGTAVWVWLALLLIAVVLSQLSRLLSRLVIAAAKPLATRYVKMALPAFRVHPFMEPLRMLLSIVVFRACMELVPPGALIRDWILKALALLFMLGAASLLMRIVDLISDHWISHLDPRQKSMSFSVLPLVVRFVKICIFLLAVLVLLRQWGLDITAVLAGVGVGGVAIALAAQKTIENLFGGISVISDRPVLVGEICQFGGQIGTVEDIGLRSTRIRTNDRTLVTVPNSQFSTMTLENFSRRDRFWFHPTLSLRRDTPVEKIQEAIKAVERVLREHPKVDPTGVPVRFTKIATEGYLLEVFSYVLTKDGDEFLRLQSELLLTILKCLGEVGVRVAIPFQESVAG
jgi:MscS family membrane protein